jgi:tetratricopeptide (TPR) repeat protein
VHQVAEAVHYAHQRGIIHRDLKPHNILLQPLISDAIGPVTTGSTLPLPAVPDSDAFPYRPKVSDFGLARIAEDAGGLTATGDQLGTPQYMPPEQASGNLKKLGPRSDVYSLGAVLYCVLTGRPPFQSASSHETMRQVIEEEPVSPRQLNSGIPRDLETICLKCLNKDNERRNATADELATDLRHFLAGEAVLARPVTRFERTVKWMKRRPSMTALIATSVVAIMGLVLGGVIFTVRLNSEFDRAEKEGEKAKEQRDTARLENKKFRSVLELIDGNYEDPLGLDGGHTHVPKYVGAKYRASDLLTRLQTKFRDDPLGDPHVEVALFEALGNGYRNLGMLDEAEECLTRSLRLRQSSGLPNDHSDIASTQHSLGMLHLERGQLDKKDYEKADFCFAEAIRARLQFLDEDPIPACETLSMQGWLAVELEDFDEAIRRFGRAIEVHKTYKPGVKTRTLILAQMGQTAARLESKLLASQDADLVLYVPQLCGHAEELMQLGNEKWQKPYDLLREGIEYLAGGEFSNATVLGEFAKGPLAAIAVNKFNECEKHMIGIQGSNHYRCLPLLLKARALELQKADSKAETVYDECIRVLESSVGLEHLKAIYVTKAAASLKVRLGKKEEAEKLFDKAINSLKDRFGENHFYVANAMMIYSDALKDWKDINGMKEQSRKAREIYEKTGATKRKLYQACLKNLAN